MRHCCALGFYTLYVAAATGFHTTPHPYHNEASQKHSVNGLNPKCYNAPTRRGIMFCQQGSLDLEFEVHNNLAGALTPGGEFILTDSELHDIFLCC